nr:transcriptional regulator, TetR family [uncultured bacterium]
MSISPRQLEIIEAAGHLITADGFSALTTKRLAERMEFSEAALYRHFKSKEDILIKMVQHFAADMEQRLSIIARSQPNPEKRIKAMFDSQFAFFNKNPHYLLAIFATDMLDRSAKVDDAIMALMLTKRKFLNKAIKEGQEQGSFISHISAGTLAHIVMGTFRLHMLKWRMAARGFDVARKGRPLITAVLSLIKEP